MVVMVSDKEMKYVKERLKGVHKKDPLNYIPYNSLRFRSIQYLRKKAVMANVASEIVKRDIDFQKVMPSPE